MLAAGVSAQLDFSAMREVALRLHGAQAERSVGELETLMRANPNASDIEKLNLINEFYNSRIRFSNDINIWGQKDYWATPLQTLARRVGDCEDFSIAKYRSLLNFGIAPEKLRMTYVKAQIGGPYSNISEAHMVLSYYETPTSMPLILDNLISDVRPASQRDDLKPVFSFNSTGLWLGRAVKASSANPTARMSRWQDVLTRMDNERW